MTDAVTKLSESPYRFVTRPTSESREYDSRFDRARLDRASSVPTRSLPPVISKKMPQAPLPPLAEPDPSPVVKGSPMVPVYPEPPARPCPMLVRSRAATTSTISYSSPDPHPPARDLPSLPVISDPPLAPPPPPSRPLPRSKTSLPRPHTPARAREINDEHSRRLSSRGTSARRLDCGSSSSDSEDTDESESKSHTMAEKSTLLDRPRHYHGAKSVPPKSLVQPRHDRSMMSVGGMGKAKPLPVSPFDRDSSKIEKRKPCALWTPLDVRMFISNLYHSKVYYTATDLELEAAKMKSAVNYSRYAKNFFNAKVDGSILIEMVAEDLEDFGIDDAEDREHIYRSIYKTVGYQIARKSMAMAETTKLLDETLDKCPVCDCYIEQTSEESVVRTTDGVFHHECYSCHFCRKSLVCEIYAAMANPDDEDELINVCNHCIKKMGFNTS